MTNESIVWPNNVIVFNHDVPLAIVRYRCDECLHLFETELTPVTIKQWDAKDGWTDHPAVLCAECLENG